MKREEKELLLKDLCARLPYGLKYCRTSWNYEMDQEMSVVETLVDIDKDGYINNTHVYNILDIKPYLRPMSSMSEDESSTDEQLTRDVHYKPRPSTCDRYTEWLNAHHFDFRNLIERGLALEAPEGMYNIK